MSITEQWDELCQALRVLAWRMYGDEPEVLILRFRHRGECMMPLPPLRGDQVESSLSPRTPPPEDVKVPRSEPTVTSQAPATAPAPPGESRALALASPDHAPDFQRVRWPGIGVFHFTPLQAKAVAFLWRAWERGSPSCDQGVVLREIGSDCIRFNDLFKRTEVIGRLILSAGCGKYRLPEWPPEEQEIIESEEDS